MGQHGTEAGGPGPESEHLGSSGKSHQKALHLSPATARHPELLQ